MEGPFDEKTDNQWQTTVRDNDDRSHSKGMESDQRETAVDGGLMVRWMVMSRKDRNMINRIKKKKSIKISKQKNNNNDNRKQEKLK